MIYKHYSNENFEDFASGRVIYSKAGFTNYPVKIANEAFRRAVEYSGKKDKFTIYDPCCGGGYLLTVLGLLNPQIITSIIASDISSEAISLAKDNLSLLFVEGVVRRKQQINEMIKKYGKQSHKEAFKSADAFLNIIRNREHCPQIDCFVADCLDKSVFGRISVKADMIITDVPYGNLVSWSNGKGDLLNRFLDNIKSVLHHNSVVVISSDKNQKIKNEGFQRIDKFIVGRRVITILKIRGL